MLTGVDSRSGGAALSVEGAISALFSAVVDWVLAGGGVPSDKDLPDVFMVGGVGGVGFVGGVGDCMKYNSFNSNLYRNLSVFILSHYCHWGNRLGEIGGRDIPCKIVK